jgi:hypothetical protein
MFPPHPFGFGPPDVALSRAPAIARLQKLSRLTTAPFALDVLHCHFGGSLLPERLRHADVRALRRLGVTVAVQFWGSEARLHSIESARNPDYLNAKQSSDRVNRERLKRWADLTDGHAITPDHSFDAFLEPYFEHIHVSGYLVDLQRLRPQAPGQHGRVPVVVHAPSHKAFKGTDVVRTAVETLRHRGVNFVYEEVTGTSHAAALRRYAGADLVIDQLRAGVHGVLAAEAMALAKPVICNILPALRPTYPEGFPVVSADPRNLAEVMEELLGDPELRAEIGSVGRRYAERNLDHRVVGRRLLGFYELMAT